MRSQLILVEQFENVVDDRVLSFGEQIRFRESGNLAQGFFLRSSLMMAWGSCFVQRPFCTSSSTIATISHLLEKVTSSVVMVSRLG